MSNKKQTAVEWLFEQIKKDIIGLEYDYAADPNKIYFVIKHGGRIQ